MCNPCRWDDPNRTAELLVENGISSEAAQHKARLFAKAAAVLPKSNRTTAQKPARAFFVPGRIEVLGKHTDYAGGQSIVAAAERGFCLIVQPRLDATVRATDALTDASIEFSIGPDLVPQIGHWSNYPMTVARRMASNFPEARYGADIVFASDLPPAAGMSSSSAMIVAFFLALSSVNDLTAPMDCPNLLDDRVKLAGYLGTVENGQSFGSLEGDRGVGTFGGSEDHTAILCARSDHVSQYAYCPVRFQRAIRVPSDHTFAIGASGRIAEKTGVAQGAYNRASRLVHVLVDVWNQETGSNEPTLASILARAPENADRLRTIAGAADGERFTPDELTRRLDHFLLENCEVLPAAADALVAGDLGEFGRLVDMSQQGTERLLENHVPETAFLASVARRHGAAAASAFGAGFGGSVWALVPTSQADTFLASWASDYRRRFPALAQESSFFLTSAGPAAFSIG